MLAVEPMKYLLLGLLLALSLSGLAQVSAIDSLRRVIGATRSDTVRGRTLCRLCDQLGQLGRFDTAARVGQQGLELVKRQGDLHGLAICQHRLGNLAYSRGDLLQAQAHYEQSRDLYRQTDYLPGLALIWGSLGLIYRSRGETTRAREAFEQSLAAYRQTGDRTGQAEALLKLAVLAQQTGDYSAAETYFRQGLQLARQASDPRLESSCLQGLGNVANLQGDYPRALDYYQRSLRLSEAQGDSNAIANRLLNIGALYLTQEDFPRAIDCYQRSLRIREGQRSNQNLVATFLGLGNAYNQQRKFDLAQLYYARALAQAEAAGDSLAAAYCLSNLGLIDDQLGRHDHARRHFERSLRLSQALDDREGVAIAWTNLAGNANYRRRFAEAREYARKGLALAQELGHLLTKQQASHSLYVADSALGNWKGAFEAHRLYKIYSDSLKNDDQSRALGRLESQAEYEKQAAIDRLRAEEARQRDYNRFTWIIGTAGGGLFLLMLVVWTLYRSRQKEKQANAQLRALNDEINQQSFEIIAINSELQATLSELYDQRARLEAQHTKIEDSIRYASRIQAAILPTPEQLAAVLPAHFIYYEPRDLVSGDFYWMTRLGGQTFLAVVDCTGHGVPGAFMSILGANLLHQIVEESGITRPAAILTALDRRIAAMLHQQAAGESHDGMDVALVVLYEADAAGNRLVEFAGAGRPLWQLRQGAFIEYKSSPHACGGRQHRGTKEFFAHRLETRPGDRLYLFSDGAIDQFGGPQGRKLGSARLQAWLAETAGEPIAEQGRAFEQFFADWMRQHRQLDDVLLVGLEV